MRQFRPCRKRMLRSFKVSITLLIALPVSLETAGQTSAAGPQITFRTVYLVNPIDHTHQIAIEGELGGEGTLALDPNTCTVTQFGETGICTRIAVQRIPIRFVRVRLADDTGQGRRLYQLDGQLQPEGYRYSLVVPRRKSEPHRLVVDAGYDKRRVITLEPVVKSDPNQAKPELCQNARYRAEQTEDKVMVYADGEHPTAGYKTAFEQLPIKIFPPQWRLVCLKPTGPVAQVVTPFQVEMSFAAKQPVKAVTVHDGTGRHRVPVKQLDD